MIFFIYFPFHHFKQIDHEGHLVKKLIDEIIESLHNKGNQEKLISLVKEFGEKLTEATDLCSAGLIYLQNRKFYGTIFSMVQRASGGNP